MIDVVREGTKVKVAIDPSMFDGKSMCLYWDCTYDWYASLLVQKINATMSARLRSIREEAYEAGWKDAKAKKSKADWQGSGW